MRKEYKMYNFKVLQLKAWTDTQKKDHELKIKENDQSLSFPNLISNLVQVGNEPENKEKKCSHQSEFRELFNFDFELYDAEKERIYLSENCMKLLVISHKSTAIIFAMHPRDRKKF